MKELNNILIFYNQLKKSSTPCALATVVYIEGSSYRRMGARMLISETGEWVGGISGGCLEGDALKRARMCIYKSQATVVRYDTTNDDDNAIGVGLGCQGIIDVMFKPIDFENSSNPLEVTEQYLTHSHFPKKLITYTNHSNAEVLGNVEKYDAQKHGFINKEVQETHYSRHHKVSDTLSVFVEVIHKPIEVFLCGHQYDLYPLIDQIELLGWNYKVVAPASKLRKINSQHQLDPAELAQVTFDSRTAAILMSHSLETDVKNLDILKNSEVQYIGLLGPKTRAMELSKRCEISLDNPKIHGPIGLDIGANTPEEIALAIVAEIQSYFSNRPLDFLKNRKTTIHERKKFNS